MSAPEYDTVRKYLTCPACHGQITVDGQVVSCTRCDFTGQIKNNVVVMMDFKESFFDSVEEAKEDEFLTLFRMQQERIIHEHLRPGVLICDVGCGRNLQYHRPADCFIIGLDPSFASIQANTGIDLRILGTALALPIPSQSVDMVVCFYSIHHMVGDTVAETHRNVTRAFREFSRVLKPSGSLFVFEVNPWYAGSLLQRIVWNKARRSLGPGLDMYLWSSGELRKVGSRTMPGKTLTRRSFHVPAWQMLSPFLAFPKLKVPRFLIPVDVGVYHWHN